MAACGTRAGYQAHRRRGEQACAACTAANRAATQERRRASQAERKPQAGANSIQPSVPSRDVDPVEDARENLAIIRNAMRGAPSNALAGLSKRRQELVAFIAAETGGRKEVTVADELAAARAARTAGRTAATR